MSTIQPIRVERQFRCVSVAVFFFCIKTNRLRLQWIEKYISVRNMKIDSFSFRDETHDGRCCWVKWQISCLFKLQIDYALLLFPSQRCRYSPWMNWMVGARSVAGGWSGKMPESWAWKRLRLRWNDNGAKGWAELLREIFMRNSAKSAVEKKTEFFH